MCPILQSAARPVPAAWRSLRDPQEIDAFGAELIDRFGPLPDEVEHLLKIVYIKGLCRAANVEKLDAGPKGCVIAFRNRNFANPAALIRWIGEQRALPRSGPTNRWCFSATGKRRRSASRARPSS